MFHRLILQRYPCLELRKGARSKVKPLGASCGKEKIEKLLEWKSWTKGGNVDTTNTEHLCRPIFRKSK